MDKEKYLNQNFKSAIESLSFKQGKSKEGSIYTYLELVFINGYHHRIFLRDAEQFAVISAMESTLISKQIDATF